MIQVRHVSPISSIQSVLTVYHLPLSWWLAPYEHTVSAHYVSPAIIKAVMIITTYY